MTGVLAAHGGTSGFALHRTLRGRALAAATPRTVSMATPSAAANGAGHAARSTTHHGVLKFKRCDDKFKTILSVDGGGLRGLVPAGMLEGVEDMIKTVAADRELEGKVVGGLEDGKTVQLTKTTPITQFSVLLADYFDVVAGTSTGAIVATYVATKGSQATTLHARDSFQEGVNTARTVKATVRNLDAPPAANVAVDAPPGSAAAAQALFLSTCREIFPWRSWFNMATFPFRPKYPAEYRKWLLFGKKCGVEHVMRSAFGDDSVLMSKPGVLASALVVTSYQLNYDRPFIFYFSPKDKQSGYASLHRTLAGAQETAVTTDRGQSDLVRLPQDFALWQIVRASTAAPTFFPTADVHMCNSDPEKPMLQMTDGGVVANNPSMLGLTFACGEFGTQFVPDPNDPKVKAAKAPPPSLAVLSLGCGTTSELSGVNKNSGPFGWAVRGPIIDILQGGAGELSAAIFQELAREWPGSKLYQFLRLQLTAGSDECNNETLSYSSDVVTLPAGGGNPKNDEMVGCFQRALTAKDKQLRANDVLKTMDVNGQSKQLLGLGHAVVEDAQVKAKLRTFVESFVLAPGKEAPAAAV